MKIEMGIHSFMNVQVYTKILDFLVFSDILDTKWKVQEFICYIQVREWYVNESRPHSNESDPENMITISTSFTFLFSGSIIDFASSNLILGWKNVGWYVGIVFTFKSVTWCKKMSGLANCTPTFYFRLQDYKV